MRIAITGTGLFTPSDVITNAELVASFNQYVANFNQEHSAAITSGEIEELKPSAEDFILKASGIKQRHVLDREGILDPTRMRPNLAKRANDDNSVQCDMAVTAARDALAEANLEAHDIDAVLVACSNMQRAYPAIAVEVQSALGCNGFAFDLNVACSSATFGIATAKSLIESGQASKVLMVNPEICSAHLNFKERDSHFIFGDVCTAVIIEEATAKGGFEIMGTELSTKFSSNIRNNAGFLNRSEEPPYAEHELLFTQEGRRVYKDVVPMVIKHITGHLNKLDVPVSDVKRLWLHQANRHMNDKIAEKVLGREATLSDAPVILDEYANTSSAGSVIAFHKYKSDLPTGSISLLCSFGAGYSVGSVVLQKI